MPNTGFCWILAPLRYYIMALNSNSNLNPYLYWYSLQIAAFISHLQFSSRPEAYNVLLSVVLLRVLQHVKKVDTKLDVARKLLELLEGSAKKTCLKDVRLTGTKQVLSCFCVFLGPHHLLTHNFNCVFCLLTGTFNRVFCLPISKINQRSLDYVEILLKWLGMLKFGTRYI